jgi:hypothetical protein
MRIRMTNGVDLSVGDLKLAGTTRISNAGAGTLASVTLPDNGWAGLATDKGRLYFDDLSRDKVQVLTADFEVYDSSSSVPALSLTKQGNASGYAQTKTANSDGDHASFTCFGRSATGATAGLARAGLACCVGYPSGDGFLVASMTARPLILGSNSTAYWELQDDGDIIPRSGSIYDIGDTESYVNNIYCVALTESSDAKWKRDVRDMDGRKALAASLALRPRLYARVDSLTTETLRSGLETGLVAQELIEDFASAGLDAVALGIVAKSENNTYGIRYTRLIPVIIAGMQEQDKRLAELEQRVRAPRGASPEIIQFPQGKNHDEAQTATTHNLVVIGDTHAGCPSRCCLQRASASTAEPM